MLPDSLTIDIANYYFGLLNQTIPNTSKFFSLHHINNYVVVYSGNWQSLPIRKQKDLCKLCKACLREVKATQAFLKKSSEGEIVVKPIVETTITIELFKTIVNYYLAILNQDLTRPSYFQLHINTDANTWSIYNNSKSILTDWSLDVWINVNDGGLVQLVKEIERLIIISLYYAK